MVRWDMILTHELQDNIAYTIIPGFTDEADYPGVIVTLFGKDSVTMFFWQISSRCALLIKKISRIFVANKKIIYHD